MDIKQKLAAADAALASANANYKLAAKALRNATKARNDLLAQAYAALTADAPKAPDAPKAK